jgi:ABC-type tungstate transport system permease subunit
MTGPCSNLSENNYGGAGALSVAAPGLVNGEFQSVLHFHVPVPEACIRGMTNGAAALRKIAETKSSFVDFQGVGSRELAHNIWRTAGIEPKGDWIHMHSTVSKFDILQFPRTNRAYVIVGYSPARFVKIDAADMEILVRSDSAMRRPFIVMEANPKRFRNANHAGARALGNFLLSPESNLSLPTLARRPLAAPPPVPSGAD